MHGSVIRFFALIFLPLVTFTAEASQTENLNKAESLYQQAKSVHQDDELKISLYKQVLVYSPGHANALYNLGTLLKKQSPVEAAKYFEKLLQVNPNDHEGRYVLAVLYSEQSRPNYVYLSRWHFKKLLYLGTDSDRPASEQLIDDAKSRLNVIDPWIEQYSAMLPPLSHPDLNPKAILDALSLEANEQERGESNYDRPRNALKLMFSPHSNKLTAWSKERLDFVAEAFKNGSLPNRPLTIYGYASSCESPNLQKVEALALARATSAKNYLVENKVLPAKYIDAVSLADKYSRSCDAPAILADAGLQESIKQENARVEIYFRQGEALKAPAFLR